MHETAEPRPGMGLRVAGAVLAGGRSTRFGTDKALVPIDGVPMVQLAVQALERAGIRDVVVVGGAREAFQVLGLRVVDDAHPGEGPLGALVTVFGALRVDVVVLLACDLPAITAEHIVGVLAALAGDEHADAAVPFTDRYEPLGGAAYRVARCADACAVAFDAGERSVQSVLGRLRLVRVEADAALLVNVNRPSDLPGAG